MFKRYLTQPSTYLGLLKIGSAAGLLTGGLANALTAGVLAAFGIVDVVRNEKTNQQ
jgi:hypothetical protein